VIDGVDQLAWLCAETDASARDGYIYWMGTEMYGVKWQNFKLVLIAQKYSTDIAGRLASPRVINLITDPHERESLDLPYLHSWTVAHFNRIISDFRQSVAREPLVPTSAPLDFVPRRVAEAPA
jgi:arylsulfatase